ncbi:hypothetical protein FRB90_002428 [Tulasnella sp. 427]|nr:hypothetical protein FRB90_002428 [Tulasnella sp. 427]
MPLKRLHLSARTVSAQILKRQAELECLEIGYQVRGLDGLQPTDPPKLRALKAELKVAEAIVPGRPIEELDLSNDHRTWNFTPEMLQKLTLSTQPITKVSLRLDPWGPHNGQRSLRVIAGYLVHVTELTVVVGTYETTQDIIKAISSFKHLRRFIFLRAGYMTDVLFMSSMTDDELVYWDEQDALAESDWAELKAGLMTNCPTLVEVRHARVRRAGTPLLVGL